MNLKKIALSLTTSSLIFGSIYSATGQTNDDETSRLLVPILDLILNSEVVCSAPTALTVLAATDDGGHRDQNIPSNTIDGLDGFNGTQATRWSHNNGGDFPGTQAIITFELESTAAVADLSVSWLNSNQRSSFFSIETSIDGIEWTPVLTDGASIINEGGINGEFQNHDVEDTSANYVRLIGDGNSQAGNDFTSINEVIINGCVGLVPTGSPTNVGDTGGGDTGGDTGGGDTGGGDTGGGDTGGGDTGGGDTGGGDTGGGDTGGGDTGGGDTGGGNDDNINFGLDPNLQPWDNFDLSVWGLDSPALRDTNASSSSSNFERGVRVDDIDFIALSEGSSNSNFDDAQEIFFGESDTVESSAPYFFTGDDGGMVFMSPIGGGRTSTGTNFPRSELREYTRAGVTRRTNGENISVTGTNENNWVLGYQPAALELNDNSNIRNISNVGGRNGELKATLRVNRVTITGAQDDVGSTIIGQIHAEDDEPLRLYYRKLPDFDLGTVYAVHEIRRSRGDETPERFGRDTPDRNLVGDSRDLDEFEDDGLNTEQIIEVLADGIALDELFSYEIINEGALITVNLIRGDADQPIIASTTYNMATIVNQRSDAEDDPVGSGYDRADESMYFKAGAYTQNNTGLDDDFDQVTFYRLSVSHDDNDCSSCFNVSE